MPNLLHSFTLFLISSIGNYFQPLKCFIVLKYFFLMCDLFEPHYPGSRVNIIIPFTKSISERSDLPKLPYQNKSLHFLTPNLITLQGELLASIKNCIIWTLWRSSGWDFMSNFCRGMGSILIGELRSCEACDMDKTKNKNKNFHFSGSCNENQRSRYRYNCWNG